MTAAITNPDEAISAARQIEEYLWTLDRSNALKNGDPNTRLSPITEMAKALSEWIVQPVPVDLSPKQLLDLLQSRLPAQLTARTHFRPDGAPAYWETVITKEFGGDTEIVLTASGDTEGDAVENLLRLMDADALVYERAGTVSR